MGGEELMDFLFSCRRSHASATFQFIARYQTPRQRSNVWGNGHCPYINVTIRVPEERPGQVVPIAYRFRMTVLVSPQQDLSHFYNQK
jgi:hypothetical protein